MDGTAFTLVGLLALGSGDLPQRPWGSQVYIYINEQGINVTPFTQTEVIFTSCQRICGEVNYFSHVCLSVHGESHVTITHDAFYRTVQGSFSEQGIILYRDHSADIW